LDNNSGMTGTGEEISKQAQSAKVAQNPLPPWDMYTVAVALFSGYILIPLLVSNVVTLINPFLEQSTELLVQQVTTVCSWGLIFSILQFRYGHLTQYLGLRVPQNMRYLIWETVKLLAVAVAVLIALSALWAFLQSQAPFWSQMEEPYANASQAELMILFVFAVFFAPLLEELIFRGLVQSTFHRISTPARSVIFTSLVFLMLHGSYFTNVRALASVFCLGVCFGIWRERTQSLLPGVIVHLINNILASMLMFFRS
jgi:membrane protease YdiL (CAAX protease family)